MTVSQLTLTNEEFNEFVNLPENQDKRFELIEGVIYEVSSPTSLHSVTVMWIGRIFLAYHAIGFTVGDNMDFELGPGDVVQPDVAFILRSRQPKLPKRFTIAPDIAVEVVSPSNSETQILGKVKLYIRSGSQLVLIAYTKDKTVWAYRPAPDGSLNVRILSGDDLLDIGDILPKFRIPVSDLFPLDVEEEE